MSTPFFAPITANFLKRIEQNVSRLIKIYSDRSPTFSLNTELKHFSQISQLIKEIISVVSTNLELFNTTTLLQEDFDNSIHLINNIPLCFIRFLNTTKNQKPTDEVLSHFQNTLNTFSNYVSIFSHQMKSLFDEFKDPSSENFLIRLGLEMKLFILSLDIKQLQEYPFYSSHFSQIYSKFNEIFNDPSTISVFESFYGSGKTRFIPIMLMIHTLKQNSQQFLLLEPYRKHIEPLELFFKQEIGKYCFVTSDSQAFASSDKLTLGILPYDEYLKLPKSQDWYDNKYIIIDEVHSRTVFLDVILSQISTLNNQNIFKKPYQVSFLTTGFDRTFSEQIKTNIIFKPLLTQPQYEITTVDRIHLQYYQIAPLVEKEIIKVIDNMAKPKSTISEGHILAFLPGIGLCTKIARSIYYHFNNSIEIPDAKRKIVILQTTLKSNESIDKYFSRLENEYKSHEKLKRHTDETLKTLYIVPIVFSGMTEDTRFHLCQDEFPKNLKDIKKLICSTPMIESAFTANIVSVIDSGMVKEHIFDINTGLMTTKVKQISRQNIELRKGRLGQTTKGYCVSIHARDQEIPLLPSPAILNVDLTSSILLMKSIGIDFEQLENLPTKPKESSLNYSMNLLTSIGAIDNETKKITQFGSDILKFYSLPIQYSASALKFGDSPIKLFLAVYAFLIIHMNTLLVEFNSNEKMTELFDENSDIVTLIKTFNHILSTEIEDDDEMRDFVEYFGVRYYSFLDFRKNLIEFAKKIFPQISLKEVIQNLQTYTEHNSLICLIDELIQAMINTFPNWGAIHHITFKKLEVAKKQTSKTSILFTADNRLHQSHANDTFIRISNRPGWNGIKIPTECYVFNISNTFKSSTYDGKLIHRFNSDSPITINSIEVGKIALNPWFKYLLEIYFYDFDMHFISLTNSKFAPHEIPLNEENSQNAINQINNQENEAENQNTTQPNENPIEPNQNLINQNEIDPIQNMINQNLMEETGNASNSRPDDNLEELIDMFPLNQPIKPAPKPPLNQPIKQAPNQPPLNKYLLFSNTGGRVFISYIPKCKQSESILIKGVRRCMKLMPFTPRSIIIYRTKPKVNIELFNVGPDQYETSILLDDYAVTLDKEIIDFLAKNTSALAETFSDIRLATSLLGEGGPMLTLDTNNLYVVVKNRGQFNNTKHSNPAFCGELHLPKKHFFLLLSY